MTLSIERYLEALRAEGERFAAAIAAVRADAPVPTCPDWTMGDLVRHTGEVHRWATAVVSGRLAKPSLLPADFLGPLPDDDELERWFTEGHAALVGALSAAPADLEAFVFHADPPPPQLFWARRQTHETEIHRIDAESAAGGSSKIDADLAADGIDEILTGFAPRKHTPLHTDPPATMAVSLTDSPAAWRLTISAGIPIAKRVDPAASADCIVRGRADDVYRSLWNRASTGALSVSGDPSVLELFRENVRIRWS